MHITQGVNRAAQIRGQATATIHGERRRSWADFRDRVGRYAAGLIQLGLRPGDRVVVISLNSDLYIETYYAVAWAGGVIVPGNFRWCEAEHVFALNDCGARLVILDDAHVHLADALSKCPSVDACLLLSVRDDRTELPTSEALILGSGPINDRCGTGDDLFAIFYTGGTTGRPKGVMLSHRNVLSNILAVNAMTSFPPDPIFLHLPPMFHLADAGAMLAVTMFAGTHVTIGSFDAGRASEAIAREGVTTSLMVPTMFSMLREHHRKWPADFSSMRRIRYGAAGISETVLRDAMALFPNADFQQGYGQTEMSPAVTILEPRFHEEIEGKSYLRSAGRPLIGTDVKVVDEQMREQPVGMVGEILARGPGVMLGYWNQPELTRATILDGWVRTGDAGYIDEDGFLYVADRLKDMIVSGGENVFSAEVENALRDHAAVAECAVIGVPDIKWGERVHAIVRLHAGMEVSSDVLIDHCRTLIARYKCPRSIEIRSAPLPLSAQGKVLKAELRKPFWEHQSRQVG